MKTEISKIQKMLLLAAAEREGGAIMLTDVTGHDGTATRHAARGLMQRRFIVEIEVVGAEFVWKSGYSGPRGYVITDLGLRTTEDRDVEQAASHSTADECIPFLKTNTSRLPAADDRQKGFSPLPVVAWRGCHGRANCFGHRVVAAHRSRSADQAALCLSRRRYHPQ